MQPVTIYTTDYCPYCTRAKQVLTKEGVAYSEVDVTGDDGKRSWLVQTTGQRTVPQIFVGEQPIGGCMDLEALVKKGEFSKLLNA
jgi:glutaredoxin 3